MTSQQGDKATHVFGPAVVEVGGLRYTTDGSPVPPRAPRTKLERRQQLWAEHDERRRQKWAEEDAARAERRRRRAEYEAKYPQPAPGDAAMMLVWLAWHPCLGTTKKLDALGKVVRFTNRPKPQALEISSSTEFLTPEQAESKRQQLIEEVLQRLALEKPKQIISTVRNHDERPDTTTSQPVGEGDGGNVAERPSGDGG